MSDALVDLQAQLTEAAERTFAVTVSCPAHPSWAARDRERLEHQILRTASRSLYVAKPERVWLSRGRIRMSFAVVLPDEPWSKFGDTFGFDYRSVAQRAIDVAVRVLFFVYHVHGDAGSTALPEPVRIYLHELARGVPVEAAQETKEEQQ